MDNSQSSDVFSEPSCISPRPVEYIDNETSYKTVLANLKISLKKSVECEVERGTFSSHFSAVLYDCENFVYQSVQLITSLLEDPDLELVNLCECIDDLILVLQTLAHFLQNVKNAATSMNCSTMKLFPVTTGHILVTIFTHCKESETIYGSYLGSLQKQLKDLFRTCHELQLIYLIIFEKLYAFDFTLKVELDILLEALKINLRIGEIVESLDLKTMAEQWKAYTMICEKYSNKLQGYRLFETCSQSLFALTLKNIDLALEPNQDQKATIRSFKVSNFLIKILVKMCHIFKLGPEGNYEHVIRLLNHVYMNHSSHLALMKKSPQLIHLMDANVVSVADGLVAELIANSCFFDHLLLYNHNRLEKDDSLLGHIILLIIITKSVIQRSDVTHQPQSLIRCILNVLPQCHVWFNLLLKFPNSIKANECETFSLYDYLLTHTAVLATTLDREQYCVLEELMYRAVFSTDWCSAMFATDLWVLLARKKSSQLQMSQLTYLCTTYQKLEKHNLFSKSPQQAHLGKLIEMLFKTMEKEEKLKIHRTFNSSEDANAALWIVLKIRNLPAGEQKNAEECCVRKLKKYLNKFSSKVLSETEVDAMDLSEAPGMYLHIKSTHPSTHLIKTHQNTKIPSMKLVSTCSFMRLDDLEEDVISTWLKTCPKGAQNSLLYSELSVDNAWHLEFLISLFLLTEAMIPVLQRNSEGLLKVLHVTSNILSSGNLESKLVALPLIFKLALYNSSDNCYKSQMDQIFNEMFKEMFADANFTFKNKLYEIIRSYCHNMRIKDIVSKVVSDTPLHEQWDYFRKYHKLPGCSMSWKQQLLVAAAASCAHQCCPGSKATSSIVELHSTDSARSSGNEFAELYTAFSIESNDVDQPLSKKLKLETAEAGVIISRIENDVLMLANVKENVSISEHSDRILHICEKLKNIVN